LASAVGCANETKEPWRDWVNDWKRKAILDCMRKVDMDKLGTTYLDLEGQGAGRGGPRYDGPDGLFPQPLSKLVANRRPMTALTGTTKRETGNSLPVFVNATAETVANLCRALVAPLGLRKEKAVVLECQRLYADPSLDESAYSSNESNFSFWAQQCERIISTLGYYSSCYKDASALRRKGARVYLYSFDYEKAGQEGMGPFHAFDLTFLIGVHPFPFDDRDRAIQKVYAPLFANFAKYGDPTPNLTIGQEKWTPLEFPFGFNYYSIDLPRGFMKPDFHKKDILFWNYEIPFLEGRAGHHMRKAQNYMQMAEEENSAMETLAMWQTVFWIVLAVLVAIVTATLALFVRFSYGKRYRNQPNTESRRLIRNEGDNESSYRTFQESG